MRIFLEQAAIMFVPCALLLTLAVAPVDALARTSPLSHRASSSSSSVALRPWRQTRAACVHGAGGRTTTGARHASAASEAEAAGPEVPHYTLEGTAEGERPTSPCGENLWHYSHVKMMDQSLRRLAG